ncbi:hypothetical protein SAMN05661096_00681 [Marivirga sericea]|uniref:Tryptophan-rich sensory protein n=1 Tax=Marivirga sericea TaxID=1028 RepID=A0A1X7IHZ4_9BACT|nr:hypothetical protein [Marivirga sericea]SMG14492.1 hypothetical protein SAMN05661096_00681 [Marivirga sericea]
MHKEFEKYWAKLKMRFNLWQCLSVVIPFVSAILLLLAIANFFDLRIPIAFWIVYVVSALGLLLIWNPSLQWSTQKLLDFLHQKYGRLEYSLSIFFKKDLNELEKLQLRKVLKELPEVQKVELPIALKRSYIVLIVSVLLYMVSFFYQTEKTSTPPISATKKQVDIHQDSTIQKSALEFEYRLSVFPPEYTSLKSFKWEKNKKIPEGSRLVFDNKGTINIDLIWQNQYDFRLKSEQTKTFTLNQAAIFQIEYTLNDSLYSLQPEVLEVLRDNPPILSTNLKENRHEIDFKDLTKGFQLELEIEDDYGIVSTDIIMTLSRGEGEAVRFREMKQSIAGISEMLRKQQMNITLPLDTFSLEPGDELYFYFSAIDNKEPKSNKGKTDVYFLSVADTSEQEMVEYEGFALTNEAEYFKSQRQIIIDTEALLAEKDQITQEEFEKRSNTIGADQKLLRLRYGVFLGEEFETTGGLGEIDHSGHDHVDLDEKNEEEEHDHDSHEGHEHESEGNFSNPIFNETPELEAYVHAHDDSELSTFLDANVKAKLKEALANMWEAELFLRTYKPKEALPFEYKALNLIKEVKRASRIYVERMGFEPPPIDEEKKRLSGDLEKIDAQTVKAERGEKPFQEKLFETYSQLKEVYQRKGLSKVSQILNPFTDELVSKIVDEPVRYGSLLAGIKQFQSTNSTRALRDVLVIMEDMLDLEKLEKGKQAASIESDLHKTYYELENE